MQYTENYSLRKFEKTDYADPVHFGVNAEIIDAEMKKAEDHREDGSKHVGSQTKSTPVDADSVVLVDSADANKLKRFSWASLKSALSLVFASISHKHDGVYESAFSKNTAFNKLFETSSANIKMNATASVGSSTNVARADHVHPSDINKAPTNHKSTSADYGVSDGASYGHVKLADSVAFESSAWDGYAATPSAVKAAYDKAIEALTASSGGAKVATGSYAGVDSRYNTFVFPFKPRLFLINADAGSRLLSIDDGIGLEIIIYDILIGKNDGYKIDTGGDDTLLVSATDTELQVEGQYSDSYSAVWNMSAYTYHWLIIG